MLLKTDVKVMNAKLNELTVENEQLRSKVQEYEKTPLTQLTQENLKLKEETKSKFEQIVRL